MSLRSRFDIINKHSDVIRYFERLRKNRKRSSLNNAAFFKGHHVITALGEHTRFKRVLTHFEDATYNADEVVRVPKMLLQKVLYGEKLHEAPEVDEEDAFGTLVVAEGEQPPPVKKFEDARFILAVDRVKYPENLAMILNTAVVYGVDGVFFIHGSCDPFNWKVLESSQGTHWNLPYMHGSEEELLELVKQEKLLPVVAHVEGIPPEKVIEEPAKKMNGVCVILGGEATGPSATLLKSCTKVSLPMSELVESLNVSVAGGIILQIMSRYPFKN